MSNFFKRTKRASEELDWDEAHGLNKKDVDEYCKEMLAKFKQDPQFELKQELGKFLLRHIDSLTPTERKRYDELVKLLTS